MPRAPPAAAWRWSAAACATWTPRRANAATCKGMPPFLGEDDIDDVPDDNMLILITGSQGEPRSALARVAMDTHPRVALGEGDTVMFSSRVIPGNERAIGTVQDNLVRRGVRTDDRRRPPGARLRPPGARRVAPAVSAGEAALRVPVHGEWRHLSAHAGLAREAGATPLLMEDGDILNLAPGTVEIVDSAPVGRLVLDGNRLVPLSGGVMAARRRMLFNGVVVASVAVDEAGRLRGQPRVSAPGLFEPDDPEIDRVVRGVCRGAGGSAGAAAPRRRRVGRCRPRRAAPRAGPAAAEAAAGGCASAAGLRRRPLSAFGGRGLG